jgi:predicted nucleic acid-binding protein
LSFVLDASVVLTWLLPDENTEAAQGLIERAVHERPCAPSLLLLEVGNGLLQAQRRVRIENATRLELLDAFTSLSIALEPISAEIMLRASELVTRHSLSLYDACYLDLAKSRSCALASFDQRLIRAGVAEGLIVLASNGGST